MKTTCIHCGMPYQYPKNAPLWPWKYCNACIKTHKPLCGPIIEIPIRRSKNG